MFDKHSNETQNFTFDLNSNFLWEKTATYVEADLQKFSESENMSGKHQ